MKFSELFLYKLKLLTDLAQVLIGVFYIIVVYLQERMNIKNSCYKVINH